MLDQLLSELKQKQIKLWLDNDSLKFRAPPKALDAQLKSRLIAHKPQIIAFLQKSSMNETHPMTALATFKDHSDKSLSFAQQRIMFMKQLEPTSTAFHMPQAYQLHGALDVKKLQNAFDQLALRHELIHTLFNEGSVQVSAVVESDSHIPLQYSDLSSMGMTKALEQALVTRTLCTDELFDLTEQFPLRAGVIKIAENVHQLFIVTHHVICDGVSQAILLRDLSAFYNEASGQLPPIDFNYFDYAAWQRKYLEKHSSFKAQLDFWQQNLAGAPALIDLSTDKPRAPVQELNGAVIEVPVSAALIDKVHRFCRENTLTPYVFFLSVFKLLLSRYSNSNDIVVGTPATNRQHVLLEPLVGLFMNTLSIRTKLGEAANVDELLNLVKRNVLNVQSNQDVPFEQVVEVLKLERTLSYTPIFQVLFNYQAGDEQALKFAGVDSTLLDSHTSISKYDLSLSVQSFGDTTKIGIEYCTGLFVADTVERMGKHFINLVSTVMTHMDSSLHDLPMADEIEHHLLLQQFNDNAVTYSDNPTAMDWIKQAAQQNADKTAIVSGDTSCSYAQLWQRIETIGASLQTNGVARGDKVAIMLDRSVDMIASMIAVMYCGAAYIPIDPAYPLQRQRYMLTDAQVNTVLTRTQLTALVTDQKLTVIDVAILQQCTTHCQAPKLVPADLAYLIYTSGSTGNPKGVMIDHGNLTSFLRALDNRMAEKSQPKDHVWLAVTSISFDISVLELIWTLSRGAQIVLQPELPPTSLSLDDNGNYVNAQCADFSLFYFASTATGQAYDMLLEGAKFADGNGLKAIWVPERHFHDFGGQFANPSVAAAAVAAITKNIDIRAGSVVLPIHSPIRVTEEWSMVDNLSNGRVGIAFASGWHFNDFVFFPQNYEQRHQVMRDNIKIVQGLWRGEKHNFTAGNQQQIQISTMPRPVQKELPTWITAAINLDTFKYAGSIGANILTHLLGHSVEELAEKVTAYRQARMDNGFDPATGKISLMLHTFIGDNLEQVKQVVETPFKNYLRTSVNLLRPVAEAHGLATDADDEVLIEAGFQRYFSTSALFGTPDSCMNIVQKLNRAGVNEFACLVDFGIEPDLVIQHFGHISQLMANAKAQAAKDWLISYQINNYQQPENLINQHQATHLQCTPSYLRMMLQRPQGKAALATLQQICVGGEALPQPLADEVNALLGPQLLNMYGPTETTVWSAVKTITQRNLIGNILTNEQIYILDEAGQPAPVGVPGEMFIGGDGVTRGYLEQSAMTAQCFVPDPFVPKVGSRMYRTGDKARFLANGDIEFMGRKDNQIKLRGYRIELQEIAAVCEQSTSVKQAVVVLAGKSNKQIVAYVVSNDDRPLQGSDLLAELAAKIPDYMLPNEFVVLDSLPLTPNGKIDLAQLPSLESLHQNKVQTLAPRNELERQLVAVWQQVLQLPSVGIEDNFFDLGGNSFLLGELYVKIEALINDKLPLIELFKRPSIGKLAAYLQGKESATKKPLKAQRVNRQKAVKGHRNKMRELRKNG